MYGETLMSGSRIWHQILGAALAHEPKGLDKQ